MSTKSLLAQQQDASFAANKPILWTTIECAVELVCKALGLSSITGSTAGSQTGSAGGTIISDTTPAAGPYNILKAGNAVDTVIATVTLPASWGGGTLTNWTIPAGDTLIIPGMTALTLTSGSCLAYK